MLFLVILFLLKNTSIFKNTKIFQNTTPENSLTYSDMTIEDLVNKDSDIDGIPDWQEGLYGLDPNKKETTPGTPDSSALEKLRAMQGINTETTYGDSSMGTENLTQTEKFSRELFATVAALNQNGQVDQATIDALGNSLAEKVQNPIIRKIFLISDIKISINDDVNAINKYMDDLLNIHKKYPATKYTALNVLQEFTADEDNVDPSILKKLDPIIIQTNKIINAMIKTDVPKSISIFHLNIINSLERLSENLSDIKLFDTDPIVSFGAISQYNKNMITLESDTQNLKNAMLKKLNN